MSSNQNESTFYQVFISVLVVLIIIAGAYIFSTSNKESGEIDRPDVQPVGSTAPLTTQSNSQSSSETTCKDVTSYDYNWDNDMLCTRPDGSTFYTDYDGARKYD